MTKGGGKRGVREVGERKRGIVKTPSQKGYKNDVKDGVRLTGRGDALERFSPGFQHCSSSWAGTHTPLPVSSGTCGSGPGSAGWHRISPRSPRRLKETGVHTQSLQQSH